MSKQPCELIQDILPLYVEDSVSDTTKDIINSHLEECLTCQDLLKQLRIPDPVMPDIKESLPQADTFKKWMKRLKVSSIFGLVLIILLGVGIGVSSYKAGSAVDKDIVSIKDVTRTLEHEGFNLVADSTVKPGDYMMGQVKPSIYKLKDLDGNLFIYYFNSIGERDTIYREWEEANRNNSSNNLNMFTSKWPYNLAYAAKNTIIMVGLSQFPDIEYAKKVSPILTTLGKAIFYNLNGGQQIVYQGEGEHWKGKVIINYYDHLWKDDKGYHSDGWYYKQPVLEFKGNTDTIHGDLSYEFETSLGKFGGTNSDGLNPGLLKEKENATNYGGNILGFGSIGGSGSVAIPQKDDVCTVTVKWNGQQETFNLKVIQ